MIMAPQINISEWYLKRLATVHDNQDVASQTIREMASELLSLRQQIGQRQAELEFIMQKNMEAAKQEPAQAVPVAWRTLDGEGGYEFRSYDENETYQDDFIKSNGAKYSGWVEPLYTHPAPLDSDTKQMVLELCDATQEHVCVWTYPYGKQTLELAKKIRERLEAGNGN